MEERENLAKLKLKQVERIFPTTKPQNNIVSVNCPSCDTPPAIDQINIHDKIAKCENCATVFSFEQEVKDLAQINEAAIEENIVRPVGIEKSYFHDELELTMTQPTGGAWIAFAVMLAFFAGLFYLVSIKKGMSMYVPAGFLSFALFFFYKYWNKPNEKIYTTVDENFLSVHYRPKNFVRDKSIPISEIEQLYVKTIASNYYSLYAVTNSSEGQKHVKVIQYIETRYNARYLEREIEKHLGIEDRRLPEE